MHITISLDFLFKFQNPSTSLRNVNLQSLYSLFMSVKSRKIHSPCRIERKQKLSECLNSITKGDYKCNLHSVSICTNHMRIFRFNKKTKLISACFVHQIFKKKMKRETKSRKEKKTIHWKNKSKSVNMLNWKWNLKNWRKH